MGATRCGREHAHGPAPQWPRGLRANPGRLTRRELGALAPFMGVGPIHLRNPTTSSEEVAAARSPLSPSFACCLRTANSASCASDSGLSQTQRAGSDIESQPAADPRTYLTRRTSPTGETMTHGRHSDRVDQAPTAVQPETRCLRTRPILRVAVPAPQSARSALGHGSGGRPLALVDPSPRFARSLGDDALVRPPSSALAGGAIASGHAAGRCDGETAGAKDLCSCWRKRARVAACVRNRQRDRCQAAAALVLTTSGHLASTGRPEFGRGALADPVRAFRA